MRLTDRNITTLTIFAVSLTAFVLSFDFNPTARLFPIVVSASLVVLTGLLFVGENYPSVKYLGFVRGSGVLTDSVDAGKEKAAALEGNSEENIEWTAVFKGFGLISLFAALMVFTNYLIAVPIFIVACILY